MISRRSNVRHPVRGSITISMGLAIWKVLPPLRACSSSAGSAITMGVIPSSSVKRAPTRSQGRMLAYQASPRDGMAISSRTASCLSPAAPPEDHGADGGEDDHHVEEEGHILDVVEVVAKLLPGVIDAGAVGVDDLGPTGDAGGDQVALIEEGDALDQLGDELRPFR